MPNQSETITANCPCCQRTVRLRSRGGGGTATHYHCRCGTHWAVQVTPRGYCERDRSSWHEVTFRRLAA